MTGKARKRERERRKGGRKRKEKSERSDCSPPTGRGKGVGRKEDGSCRDAKRSGWISSRTFKERQLPTLPPGGAVPSAMAGLTSLFGMGRGGTPPL